MHKDRDYVRNFIESLPEVYHGKERLLLCIGPCFDGWFINENSHYRKISNPGSEMMTCDDLSIDCNEQIADDHDLLQWKIYLWCG